MAKQIKKSDLVESNPFSEIKKSAEEAKASVVLLEKALNAVKEASKMVKTSAPKEVNNTKDIKDLNAAQQKANELAKAKMMIDKDLQKERLKLQKINREYNTLLKEEITLEQKELGTLEKLKVENAQLRREREKLNLETKEGTMRMREINAQLDKNNAKIKASGDQLKQQRMNVGNYTSAVEGLRGKLTSLAGAFGMAFGVTAIARNAFNVIADFDQGVANLASVLGKTREQVVALESDAKRLGATTSFTATQVAELQTEFAKLGFTESEILNATEATLNLAAATGSDLATAAAVAGSTVRGMGLTAEDTMHVTDVMAKSFSTSALDMNKFAESMKVVAPIANSAGVSLEETTAMLGALANAGISGSNAGTALRRILSEIGASGKPVGEALKDLAAKGLDLAGAEDEVGKNAMSALLVLSKQTETIDKLTGEFENADGAAAKMAETQLKTVGGAVALLQSAWEGYILKLNDATGAGSKLASGIKFLADNLDTILSTLGQVIKLFVIYKTTMLAMKMKDRVAEFVQMQRAIKDSGESMQGASQSAKAFGAALKGIGFSVAIALLMELVKGLYDFATGAARARREAEAFNSAISKGAERATADLGKVNAKIEEQVNLLREQLSKGQITQLEFEQKSQELTSKGTKLIGERIDYLYKQRKAYEDEIEIQRERVKSLEDRLNLTYDEQVQLQTEKNNLAKLRGSYKFLNSEIETLKAGKLDLKNRTFELSLSINESKKESEKDTKAKKDQKDAIVDLDEVLKKYEERQRKLAEERRKLAEEVPDFGIPDLPNVNPEDVFFLTDEQLKDIEDKIAEMRRKRLEQERQYIDLATNYFVERADERISKIEEEMKMAQDQADLYRKLAAEGNLTAKESLAEQDRLIAESNLRKEQEEKRKQRILLVSSILQSYNANLQAGDDSTQAFTKAITSSGVLQQFIAALPAFEKGTEDTGLNGSGVDGRGGMLSILHPGERVMTKEQNMKMRGLSNDEVADIIHGWKYGKLIDSAQIGGAWESAAIVGQLMSVENRIAGVEKAILNKPEHTAEIINATAKGFTLMHKQKNTHKTITKRFKI